MIKFASGRAARVIDLIYFLARPVMALGEQIELRRLRKEYRFVYRRLVRGSGGMATESDAAYLNRLRDIRDERGGWQRPSGGY